MNLNLRRVATAVFFLMLGLSGVLFMFSLLAPSTGAQPALEMDISPAEQSHPPGDVITMTVFISNTGTVSLTNFIVQGDSFDDCNRNPVNVTLPTFPFTSSPLELASGESHSYVCSGQNYEDIDSIITVEAEPMSGGGGNVTASQAIRVYITHLVGRFNSEWLAVPDGETTQLELIVENSGTLMLSDLAVTAVDPAYTTCNRTAGTLANLDGGESLTVTCQSPPLSQDDEPQFIIDGLLNGSTNVTERAYLYLQVIKPLEIAVQPEIQTIIPNSRATLTVTLTNPDSNPVSDIWVSSDVGGSCAYSVPLLGAGETITSSCFTDPLSSLVTATLTAEGQVGGSGVTAVTSATIEATPSIALTINPKEVIVSEGELFTLTITISNLLTTQPLQDISITAPNTPDCERAAGTLADIPAGSSISYTCQSEALPDQPFQQFHVLGFTPDGATVDNGVINADSTYVGLAQTFLPTLHNAPVYSAPDLVVTAVTIAPITNNQFSIMIQTQNISTLPVGAGNNFFVNAYLSSDLNTPIFVCSVQGKWFEAGDTYSCTGQITLPSGNSTIHAWADPYNTIPEENDSNNSRDFEVIRE